LSWASKAGRLTYFVRLLLVLATVREAVSDPVRVKVALAWADPEAAERAEGPGPGGLVEDRREEMEHQEFEQVWTSCLIGTAFGSGCMDSPDSHRVVQRIPILRLVSQHCSEESLNGPEGKLFSCFNAGILKIDQIKMSVMTRTREWFVFAKDKGVVGASVLRDPNSNGHAVSLALSVDCENFCGNGGQRCLLPPIQTGNAAPL
jgi:hypothetical protein